MDSVKVCEIKELCELEISILNNGKIEADEEGYFINKKEEKRTKKLNELMTKYSYGWYITKESLEEQIISINNFKKFIMTK